MTASPALSTFDRLEAAQAHCLQRQQEAERAAAVVAVVAIVVIAIAAAVHLVVAA